MLRGTLYTVTTYPELWTDYYQVFLILDGEVLRDYGGHYHDKGQEKAEGFVQGFFLAHPRADYIDHESLDLEVGPDNYDLTRAEIIEELNKRDWTNDE